MALVECRECGEPVSTQAKNCPNCGAKPPRKTSAFTWLVLILIVFIVYFQVQSPSTTSGSHVTESESNRSSQNSGQGSVPAAPSWRNTTSRDEMTGEQSVYAVSPRVTSNTAMEFPYQNTQAWLAVGCDSDSEWAYFGFTNAPNLNNTDTEDGYNIVRTRVRWDNAVETTTFTQRWGDSFLHFRKGDSAIANIAAANSVMLELNWHGQRPVYFEVTLNGSSGAITAMREQCAQ